MTRIIDDISELSNKELQVKILAGGALSKVPAIYRTSNHHDYFDFEDWKRAFIAKHKI